jgi:hypothetical protein
MRTAIRPTATAAIALASVVALSAPPPAVSHQVRLAAAPALGAIPSAFIRNQFQYCSLICPHAVEGALTVPLGAAQSPATALGALVATGSPLRALGAAAAAVTGPANAAVTPLINNDVFLVVPKAFHALDVAVVEALNVGATALSPGQFVTVLQNGRTNILDALDQPVGPPTTPTGARNIVQVVAVETINVTTAVAFQAGELLLSGAVQTADATAQELAQSGDPAAALTAGAAQARVVIDGAIAPVRAAVDTAVTNIAASLQDPFPSTAATTTGDSTALRQAMHRGARRPVGQSAAGSSARTSSSTTSVASSASASASALKASSSASEPVGTKSSGVKVKATPSAKKKTMKSGPPR